MKLIQELKGNGGKCLLMCWSCCWEGFFCSLVGWLNGRNWQNIENVNGNSEKKIYSNMEWHVSEHLQHKWCQGSSLKLDGIFFFIWQEEKRHCKKLFIWLVLLNNQPKICFKQCYSYSEKSSTVAKSSNATNS